MKKLFRLLIRINWLKTIYINYKTLPIYQACRLPIIVDNYIQIVNLKKNGIIIYAPIKFGMVDFCFHDSTQTARKNYGLIDLTGNGKIILHGKVYWGHGITVTSCFGGILEIGNNVKIGHHTKILCRKHIIIEENCRISWEVQIMDTDFHSIVNIFTKQINECTQSIYIGRGSWIANRVTIIKGAYICPYSIIASNSLYALKTINTYESSIYGGVPARLIKQGVRILES